MRVFLKQNGKWLICAALVLFACGRVFAPAKSVQTGSWGLRFHEAGKTPVGNASAETLRRYDAYYTGSGEDNVIYLTFDAGYENGCTEKILDVLKQHDVPAAFFLVGNYFDTHPELVKRMVSEGHTVGNHTEHHYDMSRIADEATFRAELQSVEARYLALTGEPMQKFYRPPQGIFSESNLSMAQSLGYRTVFWSLAYVDWYADDQPTKEEAFDKLLGRIHSGAVVLLHSTSQTNAEILDELLTEWKNLGYRFGTLAELCTI